VYIRRTFSLVTLSFVLQLGLICQSGQLEDSLKSVLTQSTTDLDRAQLHGAIAGDIGYNDPTRALLHIDTMLLLGEKLGDQATIRNAYYRYGTVYRYLGDFKKSLELQQLYVAGLEDWADDQEKAKAYYQLGATHLRLSNYDESSENLQKALAFAESASDYSTAYKFCIKT